MLVTISHQFPIVFVQFSCSRLVRLTQFFLQQVDQWGVIIVFLKCGLVYVVSLLFCFVLFYFDELCSSLFLMYIHAIHLSICCCIIVCFSSPLSPFALLSVQSMLMYLLQSFGLLLCPPSFFLSNFVVSGECGCSCHRLHRQILLQYSLLLCLSLYIYKFGFVDHTNTLLLHCMCRRCWYVCNRYMMCSLAQPSSLSLYLECWCSAYIFKPGSLKIANSLLLYTRIQMSSFRSTHMCASVAFASCSYLHTLSLDQLTIFIYPSYTHMFYGYRISITQYEGIYRQHLLVCVCECVCFNKEGFL